MTLSCSLHHVLIRLHSQSYMNGRPGASLDTSIAVPGTHMCQRTLSLTHVPLHGCVVAHIANWTVHRTPGSSASPDVNWGATGAVAGSSSVLSSVSASKSHTWGNDSIERIEEMVDAQAFREELEAALKRLSASERGAVQFRLMRQVCPWSGHVSPNKTCSRPPRPSRSVVWREGFTVSSRSATRSAAEQRDVFESYQDPCTG